MSKFSNEEITRAIKDVLEPKNFPKERYDVVKYCVESVLANLMNVSTVFTVNCYDSDIKEEEIQHYVGLATKRISRYRKENPVKKCATSFEGQCVLNLGKQVLDANKLPLAGANITIRRGQPPIVSRSAVSSRSRSRIAVHNMTSTNSSQQSMNKTLLRDVEVKNKENPLIHTLSSFNLPDDASKKGRLRLTIPKPADQSLKPKIEALEDAKIKPAEKRVKKKKQSKLVDANSDNKVLKPEKNLAVELGGSKLPDAVITLENVQSADQSLKPKKIQPLRKKKLIEKSTKERKPLDAAEKNATSAKDGGAPNLGKQVLDANKLPLAGANITIRRGQPPIVSRSAVSSRSRSRIAVHNMTSTNSSQQSMNKTLLRDVEVKNKENPLIHTLSSFNLPDDASKKGRLRLTIPKPADQSLKPEKEALEDAKVKSAEKSVKKKKQSNIVDANSDNKVLKPEKNLAVEFGGSKLPDAVITSENVQSADQSLKPKKVQLLRKKKLIEKRTKERKPLDAAEKNATSVEDGGVSNQAKQVSDAKSMKPKKVVNDAKDIPAVIIPKRKNKSSVEASENPVSCAVKEPTKRRKLDENSPKKVLEVTLSEKPLVALQGDNVRSRFIDDGNLSLKELQAAVERKIAGKIEEEKKDTVANLLACKRDFEKRLESACTDGNLIDEATFDRLYNMLFLKKKH